MWPDAGGTGGGDGGEGGAAAAITTDANAGSTSADVRESTNGLAPLARLLGAEE